MFVCQTLEKLPKQLKHFSQTIHQAAISSLWGQLGCKSDFPGDSRSWESPKEVDIFQQHTYCLEWYLVIPRESPVFSRCKTDPPLVKKKQNEACITVECGVPNADTTTSSSLCDTTFSTLGYKTAVSREHRDKRFSI